MAGRLRAWFLVVVSLVFVVAAIFLLVVGRGGTGPLATIAFFGACAGVGVHMLRSERRLAEQVADPALDVAVVGGAPIEVDRRRLVRGMVGLLAFGLFLAATGRPIGEEFVAVSLFIAALGAAALVALALGWRRGFALCFTREGLHFEGPAIAYIAPWTSITEVALMSLHDQPVIVLSVADADALAASAEVRRGDPARARARLARNLERSRSWFGGHLMIGPAAYGVDPVVLLRAIERYAGDPTRRAELGPRSALVGR